MEIKQLRHFKQIYESGSFSKAAEKLDITQQGLSLSIEKLENELGVIFFLRGKKGTTPTQIAAHFKGDADRLIAAADEFKMRIQEAGREINGIVKISLTPGVVSHFVPRLLSEFHELHPHIDLQINEMTDEACEVAVASGTSDVACLLGPPKTKGIEWTPLFEDMVCVMMHKDNPLSSRSSLTFSDLKKEHFIMPPKDFRWHPQILELCEKAGYEPNTAYVSGDIALTYNLVNEGGNIAFINNKTASALRSGQGVLVPLAPSEKLSFKVGLIRQKSKDIGSAEKILISFLRDISVELVKTE